MDYRAGTITLDARAADLFALPSGEALPRARLHERFHPDDAATLLPQIARLIGAEGDGYMAVEHRVVRPDGSTLWLAARKQVAYEGDGAARRAVSGTLALRDVTGRREAEEALRRSEERLRGFATSNVIGMIYGDIDGGVEFANDEFLRIVGRSREDLDAGRIDWARITPPEWLAVDAERIEEARARGACTPYEKEYVRPDGSRAPVLVGYSLAEPERRRSVAFILDLSETKRISAELAATAERLALAQEAAGVAIWEWSPATQALATSANYAWLFDLAPGESPSLDAVRPRVHPDDVDGFDAALRRSLENPGTPLDFEFRLRLSDGSWRWIAGRGRAFLDASGQVERLAGVNMDVTRRKELEEQQALLVRELHHRVKNTLATVQAIAGASMRSAPDMASFRESFGERLSSLGRSHSLLTDNAWRRIGLRDLLVTELEPYGLDDRITLDGPAVDLPASLAVPLGWASTNSPPMRSSMGRCPFPKARSTCGGPSRSATDSRVCSWTGLSGMVRR